MLEVTADMRDEFFEKNNYIGSDSDVLAWHKREIEKNSEPETMTCMECDAEVVGDSLCDDCKIKHRDNYPELMKELYESEPDKWVVYVKEARGAVLGQWEKCKPLWNKQLIYKLILKEHELIADAVIANPNIEIQDKVGFRPDGEFMIKDFFETYDETYNYQFFPYQQAKPQCDGKFNGGYIKASQEAYDLLIGTGYERESYNNKLQKFIIIDENNMITYVVKEYLNTFPHKQFYINNGALSWDEPTSAKNAQVEATTSKMETVEEFVPLKEMQPEFEGEIETLCQTISIKDDNGKEYKYAKPDEETELIYCNGVFIVGIIKGNKVASWWLNGMSRSKEHLALTPTESEWWENEENFPVWYKYNPHGRWLYTKFVYEDRKNCNFERYEELGYIKATQEEVMSLFQDKK